MKRTYKKVTKKQKEKIINDFIFYGSLYKVSKINNVYYELVRQIIEKENLEYNKTPGKKSKKEYWRHTCYQILKKECEFKTANNLLDLMRKYDVSHWKNATVAMLSNALKTDDRFIIKKINKVNYYGVKENEL